jgi:hypothetical protein
MKRGYVVISGGFERRVAVYFYIPMSGSEY